MKTLLWGLFFYLAGQQSYAQNWVKVGSTGLDGYINCMFTDTTTHLLYVGGPFTKIGGINASEIAVWNGTSWDSMGRGAFHNSNVSSIINYHDTIYSTGIFFGAPYNNCIAKWNGTKWDSLGLGINDGGVALTVYNDTLYVGGGFTQAGGINATLVAKYDGARWYGYPFHLQAEGFTINSIVFYQGKMYLGGNYFDLDNDTISDLAAWDGTTLSIVGPGNGPVISGGIGSMCIYHNDLYMAGEFDKASGSVGNNIMRFDGTNFYDVGGGVDNSILNIAVYNDELYAVGVFDHAGGINASKIAKWNGVTWSALSDDVFDNIVIALAFYNNELYIGGGFHTINADSINFIAKYTGVLNGIKENAQPSFNVNLYPNPANENLQLAISSKQKEGEIQIEIMDMLGEIAAAYKEENFTGSFTKQIDIANFSSGVYFVKVQDEEGVVVRKFVKE